MLSVSFPRTNHVSRVPVLQTPAGFFLGFNAVMVNGRYRLTKNESPRAKSEKGRGNAFEEDGTFANGFFSFLLILFYRQ